MHTELRNIAFLDAAHSHSKWLTRCVENWPHDFHQQETQVTATDFDCGRLGYRKAPVTTQEWINNILK